MGAALNPVEMKANLIQNPNKEKKQLVVNDSTNEVVNFSTYETQKKTKDQNKKKYFFWSDKDKD